MGHGDPYELWAQSKHAYARETLIERGFEQPSCVHCMTTEGAVPWPLGGVDTLAETEHSITCAVCHDPHSTPVNEHQLREAEVDDLCTTCHTHEPSVTRMEADCNMCHMYGEALDRGTPVVVTNHTMGVWLEACGQEVCHRDDLELSWVKKDEIQAAYDEKFVEGEAQMEAAREAFAAANTTVGVDPVKLAEAEAKLTEVEDLWHEVEESGSSRGFHDPEGSTTMIEEVIENAQEVVQLSEDALKTTAVSEAEADLRFLAVLGLGSALLVAAFRRRRVA